MTSETDLDIGGVFAFLMDTDSNEELKDMKYQSSKSLRMVESSLSRFWSYLLMRVFITPTHSGGGSAPPPPPVEPPTPPLAAYDVGKAQPPLSVYPRSPPPARAPPVALPPRSPPRSAPTTPRRRQSSTLRSPPRSPTTPRRPSTIDYVSSITIV